MAAVYSLYSSCKSNNHKRVKTTFSFYSAHLKYIPYSAWGYCSITHVSKAGAAPQRVVGQMPMDPHARAHVFTNHSATSAVRLLRMSVVFRQADLPALSPDSSIYVYPAAIYGWTCLLRGRSVRSKIRRL